MSIQVAGLNNEDGARYLLESDFTVETLKVIKRGYGTAYPGLSRFISCLSRTRLSADEFRMFGWSSWTCLSSNGHCLSFSG